MFSKGSKLYSIFASRCPKCHEGRLFVNKNPLKISGFFDMPKECDCCRQKFLLEPGFYYGAMYVSYGVSIALGGVLFAAMFIFTDMYVTEMLYVVGPLMLITTPYLFKLSRAIWINFFVSYDENACMKS